LNESQRVRFSEALQRLAGDEDMLLMLAEIAAEDAPVLLSQLGSQIEEASLSSAARTAHALKGLLSGFVSGPPTSELQPLIAAAREDDAATTATLFSKLRPKLKALIEEIETLSRVSANR